MRTYLGPWAWGNIAGEQGWLAPAGCIGAVDLRTLPQMGQRDGTPGIGVFVVEGKLPSEFTLLAEGDPGEVKTTGRMREMWASVTGFAPQGGSLDQLLMDHLTRGSDPEGLEAPKPLMPALRGRLHWLELYLHRNVRKRPLVWGESAEDTERVRDMLRREFRELMQAAEKGQLNDRFHHLRRLDYLCEQFGVDDWREFVPPDLRKDVPGRLKHETTLNETWPANGTTISTLQDRTWTETSDDLEVRSGRLGKVGEAGFAEARCEHDLSSTNHYCQTAVYDVSGGAAPTGVRVLSRFSASARTHYGFTADQSGFGLFKRVATVFTSLTGQAETAIANGGLLKVDVSGTTVAGTGAVATHNATDTAISSGLRCGVVCQGNGEADTWEASDGGGTPSTLYIEQYRSHRGVAGGTWAKVR